MQEIARTFTKPSRFRKRGYVTLQKSDLVPGILFYQLDTPANSAVKKMIVVE